MFIETHAHAFININCSIRLFCFTSVTFYELLSALSQLPHNKQEKCIICTWGYNNRKITWPYYNRGIRVQKYKIQNIQSQCTTEIWNTNKGPSLEMLHIVFHISAVHQPLSISICISTLRAQHTTFIVKNTAALACLFIMSLGNICHFNTNWSLTAAPLPL